MAAPWTRARVTAGLHELVNATGITVAELGAAVVRDPGTILAALDALAACGTAIVVAAPEADVRARVRLVLDRVAAIRATAATRRAA